MNIAASIKNYYEHEDFRNNYAEYLLEDTQAVKDRIYEMCKTAYEVERYYGYNIDLSDEQVEEVYDYILGNIEEFTKEFSGYWVGATSLCSISYGEQEEQLEDLYNHRTGKPYTMPYLRRVFESEDFYVNDAGTYAYYDLSDSGVHIDLLASEIPLIKEWITNLGGE